MMFAFLISISGLAIAIRIANELLTRDLFTREEMTKIGTAYLVSSVIILIVFPGSLLSLWCSVFAPLPIFAVVVTLIMNKRSADFRANFREALTLVSLKMKAGRSFRQSFSEVAIESSPRFRIKMTELLDVVVFSPQLPRDIADEFISEAVIELQRIDRQPHAATRRLGVYREKLRVEHEFRLKSGQVLARIHAQSLVMTGLYVAVFIFVAAKFGWRGHSRMMMVSVALYCAGAFWIWRGGRRIKWKV